MSERRIVGDVGWCEVLRLVEDPRIRGAYGGRSDAQARAIWRGVGMEEERCAALGSEVRDVDMHCHSTLVISLLVTARIDG
jgi:hypothetical protein